MLFSERAGRVRTAESDTIAGRRSALGSPRRRRLGLLDGRQAITHWHAVDQLAARNPDGEADGSAGYIDHGDVLTSAGTASGLDACLHLVRTRLGAEAANTVTRSLMVAPHREGGQSQYIERPIALRAAVDPIATICQWAHERLDEDLSVERESDRSRGVSRETPGPCFT